MSVGTGAYDNPKPMSGSLQSQNSTDRAGEPQRIAAVAEQLPCLAWAADQSGILLWSNSNWVAVTGQVPNSTVAWLAAVEPTDRPTVEAAWRERNAGDGLSIEHRLPDRRHAGAPRWFHTHATLVPGPSGDASLWLGVCIDITEKKRLQTRESELRRQVHAILAATRSAARKTASEANGKEEHARHLEARLDAIARIHGMMLQHPKGWVSVDALASDAVQAQGALVGAQAAISGPDIFLPDRTGELTGLAINELAMHAAQCANPLAKIRIAAKWSLQPGDPRLLRFEWRHGGASGPALTSYALDLIERALPRDLGAETSIHAAADGLACTISLPLGPGS